MTEMSRLKKTLFVENKVGDVKFFNGSRRNVSEEDFAREMNSFLASLSNDSEAVEKLKNVN